MTSAQLQQWIQHPELLDRDTLYELRTLVARYPYFQSLHLLYLKNLYLLHDVSFGAELRKAVLYVADRRLLFSLIESDHYALHPYKTTTVPMQNQVEEPGVDRTLFLIDAFLSSMPEEPQPQSVPLDLSIDYTAYLLQDEEGGEATNTESAKLRGQELIDGFLNRVENETPMMPVPEKAQEPNVQKEESFSIGKEVEPEEDDEDTEEEDTADGTAAEALDDNCFTETLAKIYIKQHRYEKAPKKNAYFADQIRFLEKLIINAKSK